MKTNGAKFWFPLGLPTWRTSPISVWAKGSACCTQGLCIRLNGTENKQENVPLEILLVPSERLKVSPAWATGPHVIRVSIPTSSQLTAQTPSPTTFSLVTFLTQVVLAVQLPGMLPPQDFCIYCLLLQKCYFLKNLNGFLSYLLQVSCEILTSQCHSFYNFNSYPIFLFSFLV